MFAACFRVLLILFMPMMVQSLQETTSSQAGITAKINKRFEELFFVESGICTICDRMLKPNESSVLSLQTLKRNKDLLKPSNWNRVSASLGSCYRFTGCSGQDSEWLRELLLSPRGKFVCSSDRRRAKGVSCCLECKLVLSRQSIPPYSVANNFAFGSPPQELLDLSPVELALLTPVKTFGWCFAWTGGPNKKLKGSLTYYKVKIESIVRATTHFDVLGMTDKIVVMIYGTVTQKQ